MRFFRTLAAVTCAVCLAHGAAQALPPDAELPSEPLFSLASRVDPGLVIDLSLKQSNAGAAYRDSFDRKKTYLGYWDPMGCYSYASGDAYFKRASAATRRSGGEIGCTNLWSGNLLNWAVSSSLDGLRLALTGGDRVVDEPGLTVLQRAVLPESFHRGPDFPGKTITGSLDSLTPLVTGAREGLRAADTLHFSSCLDRFVVGPVAAGSCTDPVGTAFMARVEVCTPAEAALRPSLCARYPDGRHKPVGAIQRYAGRMRFAVFGYLPARDHARYGGVLRAPMKHVGPTKPDMAFGRVDNPASEWDARTGVFKAEAVGPRATDASPGVIHAINRLGRSGGKPGAYGLFDPAGELYYESLRYLQGKAPTPEATAGAAPGNGVPWADPVAASCQRNGILLIGDPDTHHDRSLPGMSKGDSTGDFDRGFNNAGHEPDTNYWTGLVGAFEHRESLPYAHPSGKPGLLTTGNDGLPALNYKGGAPLTSANIATIETGADKGSFGMAGLAYWANTQKIRSDHPHLRVQTFAIDMGPGGGGATAQRQRGSAFFLAAKYGGFADGNGDGNPYRASGGGSEWAEGLDADNQPKPANYVLAGEPAQMVAAIRRIVERSVAMASGSSAPGGALSSGTLAKAGASVYVPQSDGRRWSGTLLSYPLRFDAATGAAHRADKPDWDAGELLTGNANARPAVTARDIASRQIFTLSTAGVGIPFQWEALDNGLRAWLNATPYAEAALFDGLGAERLAYLRGDRGRELSAPQGVFRVRDSVMGDVAHARPVFVGAPSLAIQEAGYDSFLAAHRGRTHAVYVGANDGMLHAFDARTGHELFAYVPRIMFARLAAYTSPDYVHRSHVDGTPTVAEARMASGEWKTVLVSGSGGGATGVFALDVSDPARFSADKVLWEFNGAYDDDMGHVTQAPRVMKFRTAAATKTRAASYRWFAVVPSGFNNANPDKRAALFLLSLDKPVGEAWKQNLNYYKIVLPPPKDDTVVNALSAPGDYAAADGSTRLLYAGDTQGNLWRFDFSGNAPWSKALGPDRLPLMVAMSGDGADAKRQPITVAPEVGIGPGGGAIVLFGTGKFVSPEDLGHASRGVQTVYGVYDNGTAIPAGEARMQLQPRRAGPATGNAFPPVTGDAFVYGAADRKTNARRGWYFDLPAGLERGERVVFSPVLSDGQLFFNTLIPGASATACGTDGGGRSCAVNAMTGLSQGGTCVPSGSGMLGAPLVVQLGEGGLSTTDALGRRPETRRLAIVNVGNRGAGISTAQPVEGGAVSRMGGRLNWRQIVDHRGAKP
ncbi:pilus assembly protein [Variovorax boronicumulans]|uniref:pilus assembly protein n=1 Tax=Variovorax boronicumulans TaxID=436515 RepID=UPI003399DAD7